MQIDWVLKKEASIARGRCARFEDADSVVPGVYGWVAGEASLVTSNAHLGKRLSDTVKEKSEVITMVPLLNKAPLAQKELVRTSRGLTVLVSRSQRAPQAEWLLI